MDVTKMAQASEPALPDSIFTWRFDAYSGDSWGGTFVADSALHGAGDTLAGAQGVYRIVAEAEQQVDLSGIGLEDGQVFIEWYWDLRSMQFLPTRNGPGLAAGFLGIGSEMDAAWTGAAWMSFGLGGQAQADAVAVAADARFTWVFEAYSGDRWGGLLYASGADYDAGSTVVTPQGVYRVTAEEALSGGAEVAAGTVRLTGTYFDNASGLRFAIADADGQFSHGASGLGSELGTTWTGTAWAQFGLGGTLQADAPLASRPAMRQFGYEAGGWISQTIYPRGLADVNGDGRADIYGFGNDGMLVALANASGGFDAPYFALRNFGYVVGSWQSQDLFPRSVVDVNGDGLADVVGFGSAGMWVSLANRAGGFDGMRLAVDNFGYVAGDWTSQERYPRFLADVNGDHRADVVGFGNAGVWVSLADASGGYGAMQLVLGQFGFIVGGWSGQSVHPRGVADINGDGLADIYGFGNGGMWVSLAVGGGLFGAPYLAVANFGAVVGGWSSQDRFPRIVVDVNGDHLADVVGFGSAGVWVSLANPAGGFGGMHLALAGYGYEAGGWLTQDQYPRAVADVNGDGRADVVGFGNAGVWLDTGLLL